VVAAFCLSWPANLISQSFLKNSTLREVHGCFDIWDRKYLPCNLYIRGLVAGDKQSIFICLHVSIWDGA